MTDHWVLFQGDRKRYLGSTPIDCVAKHPPCCWMTQAGNPGREHRQVEAGAEGLVLPILCTESHKTRYRRGTELSIPGGQG